MICVHPKKRATLEEIKQHRWVNEGYTSPPKSYLPPRQALTSENIDDELVEKVINFGYSEEDIIEKLTSVEANAARETYYLLKEMYEREEKLTNGDKVSFFFFISLGAGSLMFCACAAEITGRNTAGTVAPVGQAGDSSTGLNCRGR